MEPIKVDDLLKVDGSWANEFALVRATRADRHGLRAGFRVFAAVARFAAELKEKRPENSTDTARKMRHTKSKTPF